MSGRMKIYHKITCDYKISLILKNDPGNFKCLYLQSYWELREWKKVRGSWASLFSLVQFWTFNATGILSKIQVWHFEISIQIRILVSLSIDHFAQESSLEATKTFWNTCHTQNELFSTRNCLISKSINCKENLVSVTSFCKISFSIFCVSVVFPWSWVLPKVHTTRKARWQLQTCFLSWMIDE